MLVGCKAVKELFLFFFIILIDIAVLEVFESHSVATHEMIVVDGDESCTSVFLINLLFTLTELSPIILYPHRLLIRTVDHSAGDA